MIFLEFSQNTTLSLSDYVSAPNIRFPDCLLFSLSRYEVLQPNTNKDSWMPPFTNQLSLWVDNKPHQYKWAGFHFILFKVNIVYNNSLPAIYTRRWEVDFPMKLLKFNNPFSDPIFMITTRFQTVNLTFNAKWVLRTQLDKYRAKRQRDLVATTEKQWRCWWKGTIKRHALQMCTRRHTHAAVSLCVHSLTLKLSCFILFGENVKCICVCLQQLQKNGT